MANPKEITRRDFLTRLLGVGVAAFTGGMAVETLIDSSQPRNITIEPPPLDRSGLKVSDILGFPYPLEGKLLSAKAHAEFVTTGNVSKDGKDKGLAIVYDLYDYNPTALDQGPSLPLIQIVPGFDIREFHDYQFVGVRGRLMKAADLYDSMTEFKGTYDGREIPTGSISSLDTEFYPEGYALVADRVRMIYQNAD